MDELNETDRIMNETTITESTTICLKEALEESKKNKLNEYKLEYYLRKTFFIIARNYIEFSLIISIY
jgi:hypothetical protein